MGIRCIYICLRVYTIQSTISVNTGHQSITNNAQPLSHLILHKDVKRISTSITSTYLGLTVNTDGDPALFPGCLEHLLYGHLLFLNSNESVYTVLQTYKFLWNYWFSLVADSYNHTLMLLSMIKKTDIAEFSSFTLLRRSWYYSHSRIARMWMISWSLYYSLWGRFNDGIYHSRFYKPFLWLYIYYFNSGFVESRARISNIALNRCKCSFMLQTQGTFF